MITYRSLHMKFSIFQKISMDIHSPIKIHKSNITEKLKVGNFNSQLRLNFKFSLKIKIITFEF